MNGWEGFCNLEKVPSGKVLRINFTLKTKWVQVFRVTVWLVQCFVELVGILSLAYRSFATICTSSSFVLGDNKNVT